MAEDAPDLFGHSPAQGNLFAAEELPAPYKPQIDTSKVRRHLLAMLDDARATREGSPWPEETLRLNQLLFPQMSNWLPEEERAQLRFEFETEMKRLNLAA